MNEKGARLELNPDFSGITLGMIWAISVLCISVISIPNNWNIFTNLFRAIYPGYSISWIGMLVGCAWGYFHGFMLGYLIAWLYMWMQNAKGESSILPDIENQPIVLQKGRGENPFTIAFVANPFILTHNGEYKVDPIMSDKKLFLATVQRSLRAIYQNELFGLKDIFSSFRIIAIFKPDTNLELEDLPTMEKSKFALCEEADTIELLAPRAQTIETGVLSDKNKEYVLGFWPAIKKEAGNSEAIDIIVTISGSETHYRSSARQAFERAYQNNTLAGKVFEFKFRKNSEAWHANNYDKKIHAYYSELPGVIALSALDNRPKTTIHELAHALGSFQNGLIDDEYMENRHLGEPFVINNKTTSIYKLESISSELRHDLQDICNDLNSISQGTINHANLIAGLTTLIGEKVKGDTDFLYKIMDTCNAQQISSYGYMVLEYADQTVYQVCDDALTNLKSDLTKRMNGGILSSPDVMSDITALLNKLKTITTATIGKRNFQNKLRNAGLNDTELASYEDLIFKHMKTGSESIPKEFATYIFKGEKRLYFSDRSRPNAERNWCSYVPEQASPHAACTMDRVYYTHAFDKLLFDVLYDRLITKINRSN